MPKFPGLHFILTLFAFWVLGAAPSRAQNFQTSVPHAILIDAGTNTVLFEKGADDYAKPASTVKILTAELIFQALAEGRLHLDDEFTVSEHAWRTGGAPAGGSAMFLALNSRVRVEDLIRGLVIQSGNDAAITLAEGLAGAEESFVTRMNKRAAELGLVKSRFGNPWGMDGPDQKVTAREMAKLAAHMIKTYPEYYRYFGEKEYTWNKIRQQNRNPLLTMSIGADGLKTGNIDKDSGYGLVGSATQDGRRLIVAVYGAKSAKERAEEARKLLQWGFRNFEEKELFKAGEPIGPAQVYGGTKGSVELIGERGRQGAAAARREREADGQDRLRRPGAGAGRGGRTGRTPRSETRKLRRARTAAADCGIGRAGFAAAARLRRYLRIRRRGHSPETLRQEMTFQATPEKGRFITFEGGEGVGKSTQLARLAEHLRDCGFEVVTTREPGGTPKAEKLRAFLLSGRAAPLGPLAEAALFSAARADHVETLIAPALKRGAWVLCDRFADFDPRLSGRAWRRRRQDFWRCSKERRWAIRGPI